MEHTKHIWRAALILLAGLVAFIVGRHFMIPSSFGQEGHYRYDSLKEYMAYPAIHGGRDSCKKCHEEKYETASKGLHNRLNCEACHGPIARHVQDDKKIAGMPKLPTWKLCAYCHQKLAARPGLVKQIVFLDHLEKQGFDMASKIPEKVCFKCHDPHSPKAD